MDAALRPRSFEEDEEVAEEYDEDNEDTQEGCCLGQNVVVNGFGPVADAEETVGRGDKRPA